MSSSKSHNTKNKYKKVLIKNKDKMKELKQKEKEAFNYHKKINQDQR
jgi:hypothetical protein